MTLNWLRTTLWVLSAICFAALVVILLGDATYKHADVLLPSGFLFLVLGLLAPPRYAPGPHG
jgi:hypothetical protein